jgi:hypothetical protein
MDMDGPELQVNLAYQRHTQSTIGMIFFGWTSEYGAAPSRPLICALLLALLAIPVYWLGIRQRWFGSQLRLVEKRGQGEVETLLGPLTNERQASPHKLQLLFTRLHVRGPSQVGCADLFGGPVCVGRQDS